MELNIEYVSPLSLKPNRRQIREHPERQYKRLEESIDKLGFNCPLFVSRRGRIICGTARWEIAKRKGIEKIPIIRMGHLSPAQRRALAIAENKIAEGAKWNLKVIKEELEFLSSIDLAVATGFETAEADLLLGGGGDADTADPVDQVAAAMFEAPAVTRIGDLWKLGDHSVLCGNALERLSYQALLRSNLVQMLFTDPPYNLAVRGILTGRGKAKHTEFVMASGEQSDAEFTAFLNTFCKNAASVSVDGCMAFIFIDWRHVRHLLEATEPVYGVPKNICVWCKTNPGMGPLYRSQHELIVVCKKGDAPHINNIELGRHGRNRSNLWTYPGVNSFGKDRNELLAAHPTPKPINLVADAIMDCSHRGGLILDVFGGSGTTLLAAERTGRRARLMELDPVYVDVTIKRWQDLTGKSAYLAGTKLSFADVAKRRVNAPVRLAS